MFPYQRVTVSFALAFAILAPGQYGEMQAATITTFDVPGAGTGAVQGTLPYSINQAGVIVGSYIDSASKVHAFIRAADGTFTTFDAKGAAGTQAFAINAGGAVTGGWATVGDVNYGFFRSHTGTITLFGVPGAGTGAQQGTLPRSINKTGSVAGEWVDSGGVSHGFIRSPAGAITTVDVPGATSTLVGGINDSGTVTGSYLAPPNPGASAFIRTADGTFTTFDISGAVNTAGYVVNSAGTVAGVYTVSVADGIQAFLRAADGTITMFGKKGVETEPFSINNSGAIGGTILGTGNEGFLRTPTGSMVVFEVPGTGVAATTGEGINAMGAITGWYAYADSVYHGFLRTP